MSFLVGLYLGGFIVHVVITRGHSIGFQLAGFIWPVLVLRGMVEDFLDFLALPRCKTIIFDRMHGGTRQCSKRRKHGGLCE